MDLFCVHRRIFTGREKNGKMILGEKPQILPDLPSSCWLF
jgi:hypothetical protein